MTAGRIRIASYNIHAGIGTDGQFAPERIAAVLAGLDADIIALQEVEDRAFDGGTVAGFLAEALDFEALAGPTMKRGDADYGNVLLSRQTARRVEKYDLTYPGKEPRGAISADFTLDDIRLRLVATHFGLGGRERRLQLGRLWPSLETHQPELTVLCADLNEWFPFAQVHRALAGVLGRAPALRTFPSRLPLFALDRIYVRPAAAIRRVDAIRSRATRVASDHLPVLVEIDLDAVREARTKR